MIRSAKHTAAIKTLEAEDLLHQLWATNPAAFDVREARVACAESREALLAYMDAVLAEVERLFSDRVGERPMTRPLRPHQHKALDLLRASYAAGKCRPMVGATTGFGKTRLAAEIIKGAARRGKRILFVVPALELIDQTARAFYAEGITDIGVIQADHPMTAPERPVQIASIQTLQRRGLPAADLAIVDEGHRWFRFYEDWFAHPDWVNKLIIGMSATPWTRGLGRHYDELIIPATTAELITDGYLSEFRVFAPSSPDLSGVRTVAGDYDERDLAKAANQSALTADVIATWLQRANNRPTLCFAVDRAHAKRLQEQFVAAGVASAYVDAYTSREERERIRRGFHTGEIRVVCNVGVLTTGIDWDVRCLVLARPTKSEMLFVQIVGRGLRTAEGKDHCLILDHSDNHARLGFVTDIGRDRLDDGVPCAAAKSERTAPLPSRARNAPS